MKFFDEKEVAEQLSVSVGTLRKWRILNQGPKYRKIGRAVRYAASDIANFIDRCPAGGQLEQGGSNAA